jgi:ThiF family
MKKTVTNRNATIRISDVLWDRIKRFHLAPDKAKESLSYVWARCERVMGGYVVLLPEDTPFFAFDSDCFTRQSSGNVQLNKDVLNGMLVEFAKSDFNCLVNIHDHWFSNNATFSNVDDADDLAFDKYLREKFEPMLKANPEIGAPRTIFNLSLVLGQSSSSARFTHRTNPRFAPKVERITIIGETWAEEHIATKTFKSLDVEANSRHAAFMPSDVQQSIAEVSVAIAGCGGLGSIYAESLARVGFRRFIFIDSDVLEASNLNRWQGGLPSEIGTSKARLLATKVKAFFPDSTTRVVSREVDDSIAISAIARADVLIGGLDNDSARFCLAHTSSHFMVPYFDAGVAIESDGDVDFKGRYFAQIPGVTGCILCKPCQLVDQKKIALDYGNSKALAERRNAGYIVDQPKAVAPSAYALNMRTASLLVTELLNYFTAWRPVATLAVESWNRGTLQRWDRETVPETSQASCGLCGIRTGVGYAIPMPKRNSETPMKNKH